MGKSALGQSSRTPAGPQAMGIVGRDTFLARLHARRFAGMLKAPRTPLFRCHL